MILEKIEKLFSDLFFPKTCFGCQKIGTYLCQDCLSLINLNRKPVKRWRELEAVYFAADYSEPFLRDLVTTFKYEPFARSLRKPLVLIIITYFKTKEKNPPFLKKENDFFLVPIPLSPKRLKWRGFNQARELAKILSAWYQLPLLKEALIKTKVTKPQSELSVKKRKKIKNVFSCPEPKIIQNKKIVLVDDTIKTGATMKDAAITLKKAGAKKVYGIVAAHE